MSRRIDFEPEAVVIAYRGLDVTAARAREMRIPYAAVGPSLLDLNDRERADVLELAGHRFRRVVLTVDGPESFAQRVRERI